MKAITISQPYASLIGSGEKFVENRTWATKHRGSIAIHAGQGQQYLTRAELSKYPTGCVVAIAKLSACISLEEIREKAFSDSELQRRRVVPGTQISWSALGSHEHTEGPWCWILEQVKKIEPIAVVGKQGIWNWSNPESVHVLAPTCHPQFEEIKHLCKMIDNDGRQVDPITLLPLRRTPTGADASPGVTDEQQ